MTLLQTSRLHLRPRRMDDSERLVELIGNLAVSRMLSIVPHPYSVADAQAWLSGSLDSDGSTNFVLDRSEGLMGAVSLIATEHNVCRLGFWLGQPYWGKGYMSEATRAVIGWAFSETPLVRIDSEVYLDNPGSQRIHALLGFTESARHVTFSKARGCEVDAMALTLNREDWIERP